MNEELYNLYTRAFVNAKTQEERDFIIACKDKLEGDLTALKTLKNALTIETTPIATMVDFNKDDGLTMFTKKLYEIKQNQLDFDLRQNLRDWVLKNACPKEYRAVEIMRTIIHYSYLNRGIIKQAYDEGWINEKEYEIANEVFNNVGRNI